MRSLFTDLPQSKCYNTLQNVGRKDLHRFSICPALGGLDQLGRLHLGGCTTRSMQVNKLTWNT